MSDSLKRKTVSLDPEIYKKAEERMKRAKFKKFSPYIAALIEKDLRERPRLTLVFEEDEEPPSPPVKKK